MKMSENVWICYKNVKLSQSLAEMHSEVFFSNHTNQTNKTSLAEVIKTETLTDEVKPNPVFSDKN